MEKLHHLKQPFVVGTIVENTRESALAAVQGSFDHGAQAAELTLSALYFEDSRPETYREFGELGKPVYTTFRRAAFMKIFGGAFANLEAVDDTHRMDFQWQVFQEGLAGLDIEADTFDANEDEWTEDARAIKQQMALIEKVHENGGSVIMSWHPPRKLSFDQAAEAVRKLRERGADIVKIVEQTYNLSEVFNSLEISTRLRQQFPDFPFIFLALGEETAQFRHLMTHFGCSYILSRPPAGGNQLAVHPPVKKSLQSIRLQRFGEAETS